MFPASSFLLSILLATSAWATPLVQIREPSVSVPFKLRVNSSSSGTTIAEYDRARAQQLIAKGRELSGSAEADVRRFRRQSSFDVTNEAVTYVASVGVGSPATQYSLLIDTGSSNTWVGADKAFVQTSTSKDTGHSVSVTYGSGEFSGEEWTDTVTLSSDLVVTNQGVGVASSSQGFSGVDGILGVGPVDLTQGTVSGESDVPTVTDNLLSQGKISTEVLGVYYAPTTSDSVTNGELTFGGVDSSKVSGSITYTGITATQPAAHYWGIDQTVSYAGTQLLNSAGIVDTGTTLVLLATDAYNAYVQATGATLDNSVGLLRIESADYANLESLVFSVGGTDFELTKNGQTWPRALNTDIGGDADAIYLVVSDLGSSSGEGLDFINGYTFLERFYSVYDTSNSRVGFAPTAHTEDTSN